MPNFHQNLDTMQGILVFQVMKKIVPSLGHQPGAQAIVIKGSFKCPLTHLEKSMLNGV